MLFSVFYSDPTMFQVEGLMMDIAGAEEEITRWKVASQQEAAAGKAVEQEFVEQVCWKCRVETLCLGISKVLFWSAIYHTCYATF